MEIINDIKNQLAGYYDEIIVLLPKLGFAILSLIIFLLISRTLRKRIIRYFDLRDSDKLLTNFVSSVLTIVNFFVSILLFLYIIGLWRIAGSILGAATFSSIIIGFAFKDIGENFLAGVIMAFSRPFRLKDTIKTGEVEGKILGMTLRETHIKTFDGKDVYVPNGQIIKNPLYNYTIDGYLRKQFDLGIDYGSDLDKTRQIIADVMKTIPGIIQDEKPPITLIQQFNASTVNVVVQYWINTFDAQYSATELQSQAMNKVLRALNNAGVAMPGDIIELKNYKDNPIKTGSMQMA